MSLDRTKPIKSVTYHGSTWSLSSMKPGLKVTAPSGSLITISCTGQTTQTYTLGASETEHIFYVNNGTWTIVATLSGERAETTCTVSSVELYSVELNYIHIYGVIWDGTSTTSFTRTDDAEEFDDPNPYYSGMSDTPSSPFDNIFPWSAMTRVTDATGGELVRIPKFWYKWTKNDNGSLALQIADGEVDGFCVSPAHSDRGDGTGERDYVYIGRYHCTTGCISKTDSYPLGNRTRSTFRTSIHNLGTEYWQYDFQMWQTIQMLYLVEFADWDSQTNIGYGCGNNLRVKMGYTDSMPYHTGTTLSSKTSYGCSTQYRYIEGLWDNAFDWVDGCYCASEGLCLINNPNNFSDTTGGTSIGTPPGATTYTGYISAFNIGFYENCQYSYPSKNNGSTNAYCPDQCSFSSSESYPGIYTGGCYYGYQFYGLFHMQSEEADTSAEYIGARVQKLPNSTPVVTYSITNNLTNITASSSNPVYITEGGNCSLTYTANSGYILPDTVTVSGVGSYTWDKSTGTLYLTNGMSNVSVSIVGELQYYRVGGRIFYDNGDNGATYTFYDSSYNVISTQTVVGLANAYYYTISGTPSIDRWYVFDNATHSVSDGTTTYSATEGLTSGVYWGYYDISTGTSSSSIGSGKTNTSTVLSIEDTSSYNTNTIWKYVKALNDNEYLGHNDWFIASEAEQDELRAVASTVGISWYDSYNIWLSQGYSLPLACHWYGNYGYWGTSSKNYRYRCFAARAF